MLCLTKMTPHLSPVDPPTHTIAAFSKQHRQEMSVHLTQQDWGTPVPASSMMATKMLYVTRKKYKYKYIPHF